MSIKSVKVLGITYQVKYIESCDRNDTFMGRCDGKLAVITIAKEMPKELQAQTLTHEVIHAISNILELGLTETQVSGLAAGMLSIEEKKGE